MGITLIQSRMHRWKIRLNYITSNKIMSQAQDTAVLKKNLPRTLEIHITTRMSNKQLTHERDTYWDMVKAILIFLVIVGHVLLNVQYYNNYHGPLFKGIYLFHMPLFMLISGYFAAKSTARRGWRVIYTYLVRLSLPCIGVILISFLILLLKGHTLISALKNCVSLWFLLVLFECVCFYIILQWKQSLWYKTIMLIAPFIVALLCLSFFPIWPYADQFTYLWPFFLMGAYLSNSGFTHNHINWKWCGFLIPYAICFYFFQPTWYVYRTPLSLNLDALIIDIIRTIAAFSGCGSALMIAKYLHPYIGKLSIVQKIGQATLALYALEPHFFVFINDHLISPSLGYLEVFIISIALLSVEYIFYVITRKSPAIALLLYGEWDKHKLKVRFLKKD